MNKIKSLKKEILHVLIYFSTFIVICIGLISLSNFYFTKLNSVEHNQKQVLNQVQSEVEKFLFQIYKISDYLKSNYVSNSGLLKNIVDINSNISSILILDSKGIIKDFYTPTSINIYKGFDYSKKDYFENIKNNSSDYWSNVFLSSVDETSTISYSFKIDNNIAVMMIKLKELSDFISRFKNQDNSHIIRILDSSGILILNHDRPDLVLQRTSLKNSDIFNNLLKKVNPYEFSIYKSEDDKKEYGTYTHITKTHWKIVSRENYDLILESLYKIIYFTLFSIIIFVFLAIFLSLKISKRIFKSFDNLQQTTASIANGNYDVEVKKTYYEEFNKLLDSFNKMKIQIDKREDDLESSLDSFKALVNATLEAIIIHKDGICVDVNDVAIKLFKYDSKDEMIGKKFLSFISPSSKKLVESKLSIDSQPYEVELMKKDGTLFISLAQGKFLELYGSRLKISTIIDITEIKEKDKLLFQQSKMASMGEMIGNIAHQWRQPLSAISSAASGMKLKKEYNILEDKDFFDSTDAIVNSTQYLSKTIDDFRNFFKSNKEKKKFSISNMLENILTLIGSSLKHHEIKIIKEYEDEFFINGYENEFIQAMINILNNSKDALCINQTKQKIIVICVKKVDNDIIRISIKDSGGGIKKDILPSIFEPYFTTKYNQQGTGIGLYMTHQIIVVNMKGKINVQNNTFSYNDETLYGAEFIIDLEKNL